MNDILKEELKTWLIDDEEARWEKLERERVRYPKMLQEMGVNLLRLDNKNVVDIGCGPISALEFLPEAGARFAVDPLSDEYAKVYQRDQTICWDWGLAEELPYENDFANLIICMNALDHFEGPVKALIEMKRILVPGGYLAVHCCEMNAINNPHPAHKHNLTYGWFRNLIDDSFECVVSRRVRYGWKKWRGKVGQPAFCYMGRKTLGYKRKEENG